MFASEDGQGRPERSRPYLRAIGALTDQHKETTSRWSHLLANKQEQTSATDCSSD